MKLPSLLSVLPLLAVSAFAASGDGLTIIEKKEKAREERGPVVVYRYNMTGHVNYQWLIVRSESQVPLVEGLAKGISPQANVKTVEQYIAGIQSRDRVAIADRIRRDLQTFEVIVDSYENPTTP